MTDRAKRTTEAPRRSRKPPGERSPVPERRTAHGRVLLVDDEVILLRGLARQLRRAGYEVEAVTRATAALEVLAVEAFDVVVSDITMPGMDGLTLLRTVRQRGLDLPVVLVSGAPAVRAAAEALDSGALEYLAKPVAVKHLVETIAKAIASHRCSSRASRNESNPAVDCDTATPTRLRRKEAEGNSEEEAAVAGARDSNHSSWTG
jgi:DNA-binding NtrC family response regulator